MEKRRERRVVVKDPVSFEGKFGVGRGTTFNLSLGGCALGSSTPVDPDATMRLELYIPSQKKPVKVDRARVTWTAGNDFGVEFLSLDAQERQHLKHYIASL
ncbi:MAG: PilZ domain-containing protein [Nitrospirae bacterium]|nr:PilZ domain-containing protein [Nitrospirota bacterium]